MTPFSPGDRALVVDKPERCSPDLRGYIGQTVTVVRTVPIGLTRFYHVRAESDGFEFAASWAALQKLPPQPAREWTVSWDDCAWRPVGAEVVT